MSVLYLQFDGGDRNTRIQKLGKSGAHVVPVEPRWPAFFEMAKREKPYAIAIDFSQAPTHCLETADYIAKAKETRETPLYLLRVPDDRLDAVKKRLPHASIVTEQDLAGILVVEEKKAQERAREKKEAAAAARKTARAKKLGLDKPPPPPPSPAAKGKAGAKGKTPPAAASEPKKKAAAPAKKKPAPARRPAPRQPKKK
ncbi:MAG: hypothetical protein M3S32_05190 [Acidobacteriota bacterium]|nr:hypothetical protein [Acidobacteriota bacterium]